MDADRVLAVCIGILLVLGAITAVGLILELL